MYDLYCMHPGCWRWFAAELEHFSFTLKLVVLVFVRVDVGLLEPLLLSIGAG